MPAPWSPPWSSPCMFQTHLGRGAQAAHHGITSPACGAQGAEAARQAAPAVQQEVQRRGATAVMDARLQGGRAAQAAAGAAQQALRQGQQALGAAVGQLQGAASQATDEPKGFSQSSAGRVVAPASGRLPDLRPPAAAAADAQPPSQPGAPTVSQPPEFSAPAEARQALGSSRRTDQELAQAPLARPPAAATGSSGLAFHPSGQLSGGAVFPADEALVVLDPHAGRTPTLQHSVPPSDQATHQHSSSLLHAAVPAAPAAAAPSSSATAPSAAREADTAGVAKPPPGAAVPSPELLQSPAASPVEALAAAQAAARPAGSGAAAVAAAAAAAPGQVAEAVPAGRRETAARRKLRQRRVPSSQLGRCHLDTCSCPT